MPTAHVCVEARNSCSCVFEQEVLCLRTEVWLWFQSYFLSRRLACVLIVVLMSDVVVKRDVLLALLSTFLLIQVFVSPFINRTENMLHTFSITILMFICVMERSVIDVSYHLCVPLEMVHYTCVMCAYTSSAAL